MKDKILIANPPWWVGDRIGVRAGSRWPFTMKRALGQDRMGYAPFPFFMAYATAAVNAKGSREAVACDAVAEFLSPSVFERIAIAHKPTHIVLETSTPSIDVDLGWAKILKEYTQAAIILVGPHATTFSDELIKLDYVDAIITGEYEVALYDQRDLSGVIAGKPIKDLDLLPYPEWDQFPMGAYYDATSHLERPVLNVMASRGCPWDCSFCLWNQVVYPKQNRYRLRDVECVIAEINTAYESYEHTFKGLFFEDDTWGAKKDWAYEFAEKYAKDGPGLPYCVLSRADVVDYDLLKALKDSGLRTFRFGVESGCPQILKNINKQLDLSAVESVVGWCKKLGIRSEFSIAYGFPGENKDTIAETQRFIARMNPDTVVQALATPYPGTRFYDELKYKGLIEAENWSDYDGFYTATFRTDKLTKDELESIFRRRTRQ